MKKRSMIQTAKTWYMTLPEEWRWIAPIDEAPLTRPRIEKVAVEVGAYLSRWAPPLIMMAVIFWWSTQSTLPGAQGGGVVWWDFILKKTAHLTEYALLFFSWMRALNWHKIDSKKHYTLVFLIVLFYALSDEVHQSFTPGRHPLIRDVGYDFLGAFLIYLWQIRAI